MLLAAFTVWWYESHRRGFPLFIDEAGYTSFALDHVHALHHDGLRGLVDSVEQHSVHAPLVPVLTVPALLVVGKSIGPGFAVVAAFYAVLIAASYVVARRLLAPWPAALVALLVATAPQVLTFSRMYYFAVPAAALFVVAVWCFLESEALARPAWAMGGGVVLGLAVLARTMVLSLAVALLLALLIQAVARREGLHRRLLTLAGATSAAVAAAATWYGPNLTNVIDFLRGVRFRDPSSGEDPFHRLPGFRQVGQLTEALQIPLAMLLVAVVVFAAAVAWRRRHAQDSTPTRTGTAVVRLLATDRAFLAFLIVEAVVIFALADEAFGEWIMILPFALTLVVCALVSLPRRPQVILATLLAAVAVFDFAMTSGALPALGRPRLVHTGPFGTLPITDGRQDIQQRLAPTGDVGEPGRLPGRYRKILPLHRDLTAWLLRYARDHDQRPVVFSVSNESRLLNINDLLLADRLLEDNGVLLTGRLFLAPNAPLETYRAQLDDPMLGLPNFLITYSEASSSSPDASPTPAERNIEGIGFRLVRTVALPYRPARIWWRSQADVPVARAA